MVFIVELELVSIANNKIVMLLMAFVQMMESCQS